MNIETFEKKYGHYGGIKQLVRMRNSFMPQKKIALHFKVSQERVRQWMLEMFGSAYDPRPDRRKIAIRKMTMFYYNNGSVQFHKKYSNTAFYKQALKVIKTTII